jgi:hypothetical protein
MLRIGCVVLSTWVILNLVPSMVIVINTMFLGGHTPAVYSVLTEEEVAAPSHEETEDFTSGSSRQP